MKIWEKVNNITGNDSKSRYLVPYINAGSKFLLSSLPEKFLWTIASESEIYGWNESSTDNSNLGAGSTIAYDKVLAVYRLDNGKKRICSEAPDNNIHIFDEATSLLKATEMFPKFYKLSGKIYIKPDPDYNATDSSKTYTPLGGSSTSVSSSQGDKGVIVYSAPPIIDENSDSWILAEYENIVLFYAASLDHFRLASVYRDLCKAQIDEAASATLSFTITTNLPVFNFSESLPSDINVTSSLPSTFNLTISLPTIEIIGTTLPSDFSSPTDISSPSELTNHLDLPFIDDALTKAQQLIDGNVTTNNAQAWLNDEDSEMAASTVNVANAEIGRAQSSIQKEKAKLDDFTSKINQRLNKYSGDLNNYSSKVQKEATRMSSQLSKYEKEVAKKIQIFQSDISKYQAEVAKESARLGVDVGVYNAELNKEKTRLETQLAKYQANLSKAVQVVNSELQIYQSELSKESKVLEKQIQQQNINIQAASIYTQKSQQSIQTSGMYYQRAINELSSITGAITAPEAQQSSQRKEQGATS